jgi:hypothetical protein
MVKKILIAVTLMIIIGVCTGIYMWTKPAPKAEDSKGIVTNATGITQDYAADEKKADASYLDKVLQLSGTVTDVSKNQDGALVVMLDSGDPMSGVQCTMRDPGVMVSKGQNIVIKGFCKGNNMGVVLTDCILSK